MIDPPETSELQTFVAVADAGSVSGAAAELELPRTTVSRRLARLEERLGVQLMHRTTRRVSLTSFGEEFYGQARSILAAVDAAMRAVQQDGRPRGLLRVSAPPMTRRGGSGFESMLVGFLEAHPEVQLELIISTRHEDLIANNIDLALRAGTDFDPGLVARKIASSRALAVATPGYLVRAGVPRTAKELAGHTCLLGFARGERPATQWPLREGGQVRVRGRIVSSSPDLLLEAALRGLGIALLPELFVGELIAGGSLVPVLEDEIGTTSVIALVYPERRLLRPAVRALVDHTLGWMEGGGGLR